MEPSCIRKAGAYQDTYKADLSLVVSIWYARLHSIKQIVQRYPQNKRMRLTLVAWWLRGLTPGRLAPIGGLQKRDRKNGTIAFSDRMWGM